MKITVNMKSAVIALGLVMSLGGCQGAQVARTPASLDNAGFMTAWDAYRHCQAGTNVDIMRHEMQQLTRAASAQESADSLSAFLPNFVKRVMDKPASRLAADPKAMAAACALSTGWSWPPKCSSPCSKTSHNRSWLITWTRPGSV
jgi:hypothetical protein